MTDSQGNGRFAAEQLTQDADGAKSKGKTVAESGESSSSDSSSSDNEPIEISSGPKDDYKNKEGYDGASGSHTWDGVTELYVISSFTKECVEPFRKFYCIPKKIGLICQSAGNHMSRPPKRKCWGLL